MSHDFDRFCVILSCTNALAVELSTLIGVGGCGCPKAMRVRRNGIAVFALWKRALISASAAEVTTCLRVLHSTNTWPLGGVDEDADCRSAR